MNRIMQEKWPMIEGSHGMRDTLMDTLSDADLDFSPGGQNMTLGELCREWGEIEYAYIQSFKTFRTEFSYRNTDAELPCSVARLKAWLQGLDEEMKGVISSLTDAELDKPIIRTSEFSIPGEVQLDIYLQALLIFFGKATVFMKAMNKDLPPIFQEYIG